jgi:mono/diheme cytochrome c family protein
VLFVPVNLPRRIPRPGPRVETVVWTTRRPKMRVDYRIPTVTSINGRDGSARSADGLIDVQVTLPTAALSRKYDVKRIILGASAVAAIGAFTFSGVAQGATPSGDPAHGKTLYAANCAACHGASGEGGVGPKLQGEKARKNFAGVVAQIKKPAPPMPKLYPSPLSAKDVNDLAAFVEKL